jgi:hypothetical protein
LKWRRQVLEGAEIFQRPCDNVATNPTKSAISEYWVFTRETEVKPKVSLYAQAPYAAESFNMTMRRLHIGMPVLRGRNNFGFLGA